MLRWELRSEDTSSGIGWRRLLWVLLSILLCVGLWSLKVLENEKPATTAGWDSLWACLDPSPSCPFLSDGQLQAWQCLYSPAALGLHLIKPSLIVKGGELELGLSLTLFVSSRHWFKMHSFSYIYPPFIVFNIHFFVEPKKWCDT